MNLLGLIKNKKPSTQELSTEMTITYTIMYNTKKIKDKPKKGLKKKKKKNPLTLNKCELQVSYITESEITINYDKL